MAEEDYTACQENLGLFGNNNVDRESVQKSSVMYSLSKHIEVDCMLQGLLAILPECRNPAMCVIPKCCLKRSQSLGLLGIHFWRQEESSLEHCPLVLS